ncbi:MAG TPA: alpha/beta hydrolase [Baekduia sp.]|nr:alpha/beta hydrolase [Baekduia sp.]
MDHPVSRALVRDDVELAYWRFDGGGLPLLLVHGWPETKRLYARVAPALAEAGFDVVVPDLRGFGDSSVPADGFFDLAAHARDLEALLRGLGMDRCAAAGGDLGGGVVIDLGLRFPGLVVRQVLFNCILPLVPGADGPPSPEVRTAADYFVRQGRDADGLTASLRSDEERIRYVEQFYGSRFWATPGAFDGEARRWHAEPFGDAVRFRASLGNYESAQGRRPLSEKPRWFERSPVPALALYGPDDHVMHRDWPERAEAALAEVVGPFVVPRAGHFLPWERPELFARAVTAFLRDLL